MEAGKWARHDLVIFLFVSQPISKIGVLLRFLVKEDIIFAIEEKANFKNLML